MNSKQQEIKELNRQIKQLQDKVESLKAQDEHDINIGEWYAGIDRILVVTDLTTKEVSCTTFRNDGCYGINIDDEDWYSHSVFNNDFANITQYEAKDIFNKYIEDLKQRFIKRFES